MGDELNTVVMAIGALGMILVVYIVTITSIVIHTYTKQKEAMFEINMKMAEAQASAANPLKFDEIKRIIEGIIINTTIMEIILNGYAKMTSEELSLLYDNIVEDISIKTEQSLSPELIRQWEKFASEDYRTKFIVFTVRVSFMAQCQSEQAKLRRTMQSAQRPRTTPDHNKQQKESSRNTASLDKKS